MAYEQESPFLQEQIRTQLYAHQFDYEPGILARDGVDRKVFVGIAGPFGVGKSTITDEVLYINPDIQPINTTTTRGRKPEDPAGFKTANEGVTFTSMRDAVNNGELVNYSVIPGADIYGTYADDFPGKYSIGPFLPASIDHIMKAGFERSHFVYIVTAGDLWRSFIEKSRQSLPAEKFQSRVKEALHSIDFAMKNAEILHFIENRPGQDGIARTASTISKLATTGITETLSFDDAKQYLADMQREATLLKEA